MVSKRERSVYRKRVGCVGLQKQASEDNQSSLGDQHVDSDISDSQMSDLGDTLADKGATTPQLEGTPTPINALRWKLSQPSCLGTPKDATEERIDYQTSAYSDTAC
jgi:hypothetical protein